MVVSPFGPLFSMGILVALFVFGPVVVVGTTLVAALGILAIWWFVRRSRTKSKQRAKSPSTSPSGSGRTRQLDPELIGTRYDRRSQS